MRILTVLVSYNRLGLLLRTLESYQDTVTGPHKLLVVDNGSEPKTREWLAAPHRFDTLFFAENKYPGFAANTGWEKLLQAPQPLGVLLHRSDNDVEYLPGWADHVRERFTSEPDLGQLGLRTLEEEGNHAAVGGNCVLRRDLFDQGVRYEGRPWGESAFEDANLSAAIAASGQRWARATRPCVVHTGIASSTDPYYQETFNVRNIRFADWGIT